MLDVDNEGNPRKRDDIVLALGGFDLLSSVQ